MFNNKILLITGGTGSFGNAMVNYLSKIKFKEIRIFSRDEKKQEDMRNYFLNSKLKFIIGDVRDKQSLNFALRDVDYIFHAAALKQVPTCEFFPLEAVKTNIIGTNNVIESAIENHVKKIVILSTDKAVYPLNAMGVSKAMAEKFVLANSLYYKSSNKIVICATRYGNVIGSRGSVIPLFINQIKKNQPLTITDPKMTRFLMTLEESVDLILYAFKKGKNGDILVHKSPSSTILNIAEAIKDIFDYKKSNKIIGTRHGEKLYETLVSKEERSRAISNHKYFIIPSDKRDLNYNEYFTKGESEIRKFEDYHSNNTKIMNVSEVKNIVLKTKFFNKSV